MLERYSSPNSARVRFLLEERLLTAEESMDGTEASDGGRAYIRVENPCRKSGGRQNRIVICQIPGMRVGDGI